MAELKQVWDFLSRSHSEVEVGKGDPNDLMLA